MVVLNIEVDGEKKTLYMDDMLNSQLEKKVIPNVHKKDADGVYIIDGEERAGKSVFAMQLAKKLDPNFCLDRVCFDAEEFTKAVIKAKKGQCIIYDEAFTGLSSRGSLSEVNRLLVSLMMEMGQKNLFIIIVMPTFFLLDKYVAIWRARGLFHVYTKGGKRGYWLFFNRKTKKLLYLLGKKLYDYSKPKSNFRGRFYDQYVINEKEYREKKGGAMNRKSRVTKAVKYMNQRNNLFWMLYDKYKVNQTNISKICKEYDIIIERRMINEIILQKKKEMIEDEVLREELEEEKEEELKKLRNSPPNIGPIEET